MCYTGLFESKIILTDTESNQIDEFLSGMVIGERCVTEPHEPNPLLLAPAEINGETHSVCSEKPVRVYNATTAETPEDTQ